MFLLAFVILMVFTSSKDIDEIKFDFCLEHARDNDDMFVFWAALIIFFIETVVPGVFWWLILT